MVATIVQTKDPIRIQGLVLGRSADFALSIRHLLSVIGHFIARIGMQKTRPDPIRSLPSPEGTIFHLPSEAISPLSLMRPSALPGRSSIRLRLGCYPPHPNCAEVESAGFPARDDVKCV